MPNNLTLLAQVFEQITDPRGKQGREHPLSALLAKISLTELQDAFAVFLSGLLQDKTLTAAASSSRTSLGLCFPD
ncbi:MAG: transposase family protein [Planctomycetaceae bacterium]|jgi:hypothetical protein|nr:transposase family protein [Planctomycetaceae bacterium]